MKKVIPLLCVLLSFFSCNDNNFDEQDLVTVSSEKSRVLKERDPNIPWVPTEYKSKTILKTKTEPSGRISMSYRDYLGCSYKSNIYPFEDTRNLGFPVIDINKLSNDYPSYVLSWKNNTGEANVFSYASFDRYNSNSTVTKKVSTGFSLNLGLFSIGAKHSYSNVFTNTLTENRNSVFGELNVIIRDSCYRIQLSSNIKNKIKEKYLLQEFKDELYHTHPSEVFCNYGGFVLSNYVTGGKATAMYIGTYKQTATSETKEKKMKNEISASYGFNFSDKDGKASGNLSLGRGNNSGISTTNEFSSINMAIRTLGGNSSFASFSVPKEIKDTNVDLSDWITSLNDKSNNTLIEFGIDGLIPISDLIVENNLRKEMEKYYVSGVTTPLKLIEPYISIDIVYWNNQVLALGANLNTRFGDKVLLTRTLFLPQRDEELIKKYPKEEAERISKKFGLKVVNNYNNIGEQYSVRNSDLSDGNTVLRGGISDGPIVSDIFDKSHMKKFIYNGTLYLISDLAITTGDNRKSAFSIHDDRFLDEYAMRNFVNSLQTVNMDYDTLLRDYVVSAL